MHPGRNRSARMTQIDYSRPIHLIVNPHSGYGGQSLLLGDVRAAVRSLGVELIEYTTQSPEDATHYASGIAHQSSVVMVWGGDGTAREVAEGLSGTDTPMLACPVGTENLLAKELRIPRRPSAIVEILRTGRVVDCDIAHVNDRNFLLIMGVGFDGEVVRRLTTQRSGHISHLSYFWPIWRTFWEHDFPRMRILVDGEELFNDYGLAFIGNISRYAVGLRICRDARYDDGLLDLVVFSCQQQTALLLHATWTLLRLHPLKGNVIYRRIRNVHIETDSPVPSQVDGDVGPSTPLDVSVSPRQVKLLIPPRRESFGGWPWRGERST